jgi:hypothetical protein
MVLSERMLLRRTRRRWKDNIKTYLRDIAYDDGKWVEQAQDMVQSWAAVMRFLSAFHHISHGNLINVALS